MGKSISAYILDFCAYGEEPLHIVLASLLDQKLIANAADAVRSILHLLNDGHLSCNYHSDLPSDRYQEVPVLTEEHLRQYVERHEKRRFEDYPGPEDGGEYFLRTTGRGFELVNGRGA